MRISDWSSDVCSSDLTLIGGKEKNKHVSKRNPKNIGSMGKECAFSLVERGGRVRSFHVKSVSAKNLGPILFAQVDRASTLMSDDAGQYRLLGPAFTHHESVHPRTDEYNPGHANTKNRNNEGQGKKCVCV